MVKENQLDLNIKDGKKLNINLYEIRLEEIIYHNNTVLDAFFFDCRCALFLVDITSDDNLDSINTIIKYINNDKDRYSDMKKILVLNKMDINKEMNDIINNFINDNPDIEQISISIKNGNNLDKLLIKTYEEINSKEKKLVPIYQVMKRKFTVKIKEKLDKEFKSLFSFILLGDSGVGKTNFMTRYANNSFNQIFLSTNGFNQEMKLIKINDNNYYGLTLMDTAGQERFKSLPKKYYRDADGVLLLFDVNDRESFNEVNNWVSQIKEYSMKYKENEEDDIDKDNVINENKNNDVVIYLLGNKIDMTQEYEWAVTRKEIDDLIDKLNIKYYDICCKWNLNVEEIMARLIFDCHNKKIISRAETIKLTKTQLTIRKEKECCLGKKGSKKSNKNQN